MVIIICILLTKGTLSHFSQQTFQRVSNASSVARETLHSQSVSSFTLLIIKLSIILVGCSGWFAKVERIYLKREQAGSISWALIYGRAFFTQ